MPSEDDRAGTINLMILEKDRTEKFADVPIPKGRFIARETERMSTEIDADVPQNSSEP